MKKKSNITEVIQTTKWFFDLVAMAIAVCKWYATRWRQKSIHFAGDKRKKKQQCRSITHHVPFMWPFIRGERPRNRLLWRKSSCPPFSTLFSDPLPILLFCPTPNTNALVDALETTSWKIRNVSWCHIAPRRKMRGGGKRKMDGKWQEDDSSQCRRRRGSEDGGEERTQRHSTTRGRGKGQSEETRSTLCLWSAARVNDRPCGGRVAAATAAAVPFPS